MITEELHGGNMYVINKELSGEVQSASGQKCMQLEKSRHDH
jgi:hypothetical protein